MSVYNSIVTRSEAAALIPEDVSAQIFQDMPSKSVVMQLGTRLPNMSRKQRRLPVLSTLPTAYFVNPSDTGIKQTSEQNWDNVYLEAEELAAIIPIPEAVLSDSEYDMWAEIRPRVAEAMASAFDGAVLVGANAPSAWPDDLSTGSNAASQRISLASFTDLYDALMGEGGACDLIESDGFNVTGHVAVPGQKAKLRGLRDSDGQPIFVTNMQGATQYGLDGSPVYFLDNGSATASDFLFVSGQWSKLVWAVRQDISFKLLDQAVITDGSNNVVYNLAQQDMVALRVVMRLGWALPNPPNRVNTNGTTRYPFSVLTA